MLFTPVPQAVRRAALFTPATGTAQLAPAPVPPTFSDATSAPALPLPADLMQPVAPSSDELQPTPRMMNQFALALDQWFQSCEQSGDDVRDVATHLPLLAAYESLCDREIATLEARLQRPTGSACLVAALTAECELLRGERNSWHLLRVLYSDFASRQLPPPELPASAPDWGAELRKLGPEPPALVSAEVDARVADGEAGGGLSRKPAAAGLATRTLHDAKAMELRVVAADPLLDLALRLKGWLEHAATERVRLREVDVSMGTTKVKLRVRARVWVRVRVRARVRVRVRGEG